MTLFDMCRCCLDITGETKFYIWSYTGMEIGVFSKSKIPEEYRRAQIHEYTSQHDETDNVVSVTVIMQEG